MSSWIDKKTNTPIDSIDFIPKSFIGFIYLIITYTGKRYIGKKNFYTKRKRKFGKKESTLITDKRKKLWEHVIKESDWKTYVGSNKELQKDIAKGVKYDKYIIDYARSKKQLSYKETKQLYINEVLESDNFYNDNIEGRFFRKDVKQ